jgi:hypothetical protein
MFQHFGETSCLQLEDNLSETNLATLKVEAIHSLQVSELLTTTLDRNPKEGHHIFLHVS